ncbi:MAG: type IV pilus secretin PilQ [Desulfobacterales bacterium]
MAFYGRFDNVSMRLIGFFLTTALWWGCSTPPPPADRGFFEEWKARVAESQAYSPSPKKHARESSGGENRGAAAKTDILLPPPEKPLPTRKITMKMNDIEVSVLLRALARVANQNIMLNDRVTGKININITEAPWDQVFKSILRTQGLTFAWEGDIIRVMTIQDMETELRREVQRNELDKAEPLTTEVVKISYASAAKLRENLEQFLSLDREGKPLGSVLVDDHTNSLIIQAIPSDLRRMIAVVDQLDRPIAQILIQAYIVETSNDTARALGVQWGGLAYGTANGNNIWAGPNGVNFEDRNSIKDDDGNPLEFLWPLGNISNFPINLQDNIGLSLGFLFQNVGRTALSLQLQALQEEGRLNILSSPSITTLENQIALIESGSRIPIQTVENGEVNIEYVQATLRLEVTPNVIDADSLKLKILTNKDEPDFSRPVAGNPTIITKKAETNVILLNGQTTVIGGLNKETTSSNQAGIPYLKDVPGLGWLFGSRSRGGAMEDVLIFITPYILEEKAADRANFSSDRPQGVLRQTPP